MPWRRPSMGEQMKSRTNVTLAGCLAICFAPGALIPVSSGVDAQALGSLPFDTPTAIDGIEIVCTGVDSDSRGDLAMNRLLWKKRKTANPSRLRRSLAAVQDFARPVPGERDNWG